MESSQPSGGNFSSSNSESLKLGAFAVDLHNPTESRVRPMASPENPSSDSFTPLPLSPSKLSEPPGNNQDLELNNAALVEIDRDFEEIKPEITHTVTEVSSSSVDHHRDPCCVQNQSLPSIVENLSMKLEGLCLVDDALEGKGVDGCKETEDKAFPREGAYQKPHDLALPLGITPSSVFDCHPSTSLATANPEPPTGDFSPEGSIYQIKWITFGADDKPCPVVTQNKNGPCPLISIVNALLLSHRIELQPNIEYQAGENLMSQLASMLLESIPPKASDAVLRNYEQNVQDALAILPKLQTGLDINVRFSGPRQYEFTQDTLVFDVLDVPLVHGWIVDSSDPAKLVIDKCGSYNHLVEFIINSKHSPGEDFEQVLLAEDWLERTRSQLTYAGLIALVECLENDVPCVLFRNNHFTTILKHNDQIYALITDQGYANEPSCVWEQISNIEGDTDFFDAKFSIHAAKESSFPPVAVLAPEQQMELDLQLAMSLQEQPSIEGETFDVAILPVPQERVNTTKFPQTAHEKPTRVAMSDYEMAKKLQAEEDAFAATGQRQNRTPPKPMTAVSSSQSAQSFADQVREKEKESRRKGVPSSTAPSTARGPGRTGEPESTSSYPYAPPAAGPLPMRPSSTTSNLSQTSHSHSTTTGASENKNKSCIVS